MRLYILSAFVLFSCPVLLLAEPAAAPAKEAIPMPHDFAKWEKDVAAFEKKDAQSPPPKHAVLFVGSSGIVRWKTLAEDYKGTTVLNRGFGGNEIADSVHFADRMIFPYLPRMIFLRAGGNDIHAGRSAAEVFGDYKAFVAAVRSKFPEIPIAYIGLNSCRSRWSERAEGDKLNASIAAYAKENKNLLFIDTSKTFMGADGQPRAELFVEDQLHFNEAGYKLLAEVVRPFVPKD